MELDPLAFTLGRTTQKLIYRALKKLLEPAHPVKFDYLHPTFKFKESGAINRAFFSLTYLILASQEWPCHSTVL